jgi:dTMP kinase
VAQGYAQRAQAQPQRFARIPADQPRDAVWASVAQAVAPYLKAPA